MLRNIILVRAGYSEKDVWGSVIPDKDLYTFLIEGESLDAPYAFPAGSTRDNNGFCTLSTYVYRE